MKQALCQLNRPPTKPLTLFPDAGPLCLVWVEKNPRWTLLICVLFCVFYFNMVLFRKTTLAFPWKVLHLKLLDTHISIQIPCLIPQPLPVSAPVPSSYPLLQPSSVKVPLGCIPPPSLPHHSLTFPMVLHPSNRHQFRPQISQVCSFPLITNAT